MLINNHERKTCNVWFLCVTEIRKAYLRLLLFSTNVPCVVSLCKSSFSAFAHKAVSCAEELSFSSQVSWNWYQCTAPGIQTNPAPGLAIIILWEVVCMRACTWESVCAHLSMYMCVCMCFDTELTLVYSLITLRNWMHIYQRENSCSKNQTSAHTSLSDARTHTHTHSRGHTQIHISLERQIQAAVD